MTLIKKLTAIQLKSKSVCLSNPGKVFFYYCVVPFPQAQSQCKGSALLCLNALLSSLFHFIALETG